MTLNGPSGEPLVQDLSRSAPPKGFRGRSAAFVQLWWIVQSLLVNPSPQALYGWRRAILRLFGARIGRGVKIRPSVVVTYPWKVRIGDHSQIGDNAELYSLGEIEIGHNTVISQRCYVCAATHDHTKADFPLIARKVTIGDQVWVAAESFIAPGVTIGDGALIGACSKVFSDVPPLMKAKGCPAVVYGPR